jgi:hypothetical protein
VAEEKRPVAILRRPHAPLAKVAAEFPNVGLDLIHDVVFVDAHNRTSHAHCDQGMLQPVHKHRKALANGSKAELQGQQPHS